MRNIQLKIMLFMASIRDLINVCEVNERMYNYSKEKK